jgi:Tfp pilus assembly protein PilO
MRIDLKSKIGNIKLKPQVGLTPREFMLIAVLIIAIEGYLLFSYVLQPAYKDYKSSVEELDERKTVLTGLKIDYARKAEMENEIDELDKKIIELQKQMPAYVSQEEVILFIENMSSRTGLKVQTINFGGTGGSGMSTSSGTVQQTDGTASDGTVVDASGAVIYKQSVSISFRGDYQQVYDFMKSVEDNERKVSIDSVSLQTSTEDMSGVMTLSFISYWDNITGQKTYEMVPATIPGKANPFVEYSGYSATSQEVVQKPKETVRPDFYLMINSYLNNSSKIFMMNYFDSGSEAIDDRNEVVTAQLTLEGSGGTYTYRYKLGSYDINGSGPLEVKNGKIRMDVVVQPRKSDEDRVGVLLDIANNSDVPFEITVKGDDSSNPRFIPGKTVGSVAIK